MRKGEVEIITDNLTGERGIPSIVCFKVSNKYLIGRSAKYNMLEYPNLTISNSIKLLGLKFSDKIVQEDIKNLPVTIIEDKKTGKPQYVIKIENEEKKYFPEEVASMILNYLKGIAEIYENKEINKVIIAVQINFNKLQREATIEAAKLIGFEDIKLINEPTAAAIAYGDIIKSNKERKILIFDLGDGTFDCSILKYKKNEYNVLASLGEEHLGGEDFNQRIIEYVINEIKKDDKFKNIDFDNKDDKKVIKLKKKLKIKAEDIKIVYQINKMHLFLLIIYMK